MINFKKVVFIIVALIILIVGATLFLRYLNESVKEKGVVQREESFKKEDKTLKTEEKKEKEEKVFPKEAAKTLPKLVLVIDDIGHSKELGEEVLSLKNVTISIIPNLKYSLYFAEKGHKLGKDILVHVPMEPKDKNKYGEDLNILKTDMTLDEIKQLTEDFLKGVPYAKGANNHMGSKFTEDGEKLEAFFVVLKKKGLFFLDSRTSSESKAYEGSKRLGIKSFQRDIFLDHEVTESKISEQLDIAIKEAYAKGYAIAIGHPHRETINVLKKRYDEITKVVDIVPLSKL